jgi:hypothetical protein
VSLVIAAGADEKLPALADADTRVPPTAPLGENNGLGVLSAELERGEAPRALVEVAVPAGKPFDLFAEGPTAGWALPLPKRIASGDGRARFAVAIDGAPSDAAGPLPSSLRLTLVAGDDSVEVLAPLD